MYDLNPQPMNLYLRQWPSTDDRDKDSPCMQFTSALSCEEGRYTIKKIMPKNES